MEHQNCYLQSAKAKATSPTWRGRSPGHRGAMVILLGKWRVADLTMNMDEKWWYYHGFTMDSSIKDSEVWWLNQSHGFSQCFFDGLRWFSAFWIIFNLTGTSWRGPHISSGDVGHGSVTILKGMIRSNRHNMISSVESRHSWIYHPRRSRCKQLLDNRYDN